MEGTKKETNQIEESLPQKCPKCGREETVIWQTIHSYIDMCRSVNCDWKIEVEKEKEK